MPGRKKTICGVITNKGTPCQCKALGNGRCRYHGGEGVADKDRERAMRALTKLRKETRSWLHKHGVLG